MEPLVSVLIPAYNAERWIKKTIQSVLNQTWPFLEIIVVDDGSADRTLETVQSIRSNKVKVVKQANAGACAARNAALSLAQGTYIQWLDADDLLHPAKIAFQLKAAAKDGTDRTLLTCAWGKFFFRHQKARFVPDSLWQDLSPGDWIINKFTNNVWMNPTVWLVPRNLIERAGPWDGRLSISGDDDGEYICRIVAASDGVKFVPEAKCYYRIGTPGSLNWDMGKSYEKLESLLLSLRLSIDHLLGLEDSARTRRAALNLLQTWVAMFPLDAPDLFSKMEEMAGKLGGTLDPHQETRKYLLAKRIFGKHGAKKIMKMLRNTKSMTQSYWDRALYYLSSSHADRLVE
jgi:glycosyltransferase involved in cell wall biosynthesis